MDAIPYLFACALVMVIMGLGLYGLEHVEIKIPEHTDPFQAVCRVASFEYRVETALTGSPGETENLAVKLDRLSWEAGYESWVDLCKKMADEDLPLYMEGKRALLDTDYQAGQDAASTGKENTNKP